MRPASMATNPGIAAIYQSPNKRFMCEQAAQTIFIAAHYYGLSLSLSLSLCPLIKLSEHKFTYHTGEGTNS